MMGGIGWAYRSVQEKRAKSRGANPHWVTFSTKNCSRGYTSVRDLSNVQKEVTENLKNSPHFIKQYKVKDKENMKVKILNVEKEDFGDFFNNYFVAYLFFASGIICLILTCGIEDHLIRRGK
jgi:RIO-like serine/threonine protein kinase